MADPDNKDPKSQPPVPPKAAKGEKNDKPVRVDLHNPTRARRIIDSALVGATPRQITIEPGETKKNVEVAEWVAKELQSRTRPRGKEKSDVLVYKAGEAPDPSKPNDADQDPDTDDGE